MQLEPAVKFRLALLPSPRLPLSNPSSAVRRSTFACCSSRDSFWGGDSGAVSSIACSSLGTTCVSVWSSNSTPMESGLSSPDGDVDWSKDASALRPPSGSNVAFLNSLIAEVASSGCSTKCALSASRAMSRGLFVAESHRLAVFPWPIRCAESLPFHNVLASIDYGFKADC